LISRFDVCFNASLLSFWPIIEWILDYLFQGGLEFFHLFTPFCAINLLILSWYFDNFLILLNSLIKTVNLNQTLIYVSVFFDCQAFLSRNAVYKIPPERLLCPPYIVLPIIVMLIIYFNLYATAL
jgi:hypothetical protein